MWISVIGFMCSGKTTLLRRISDLALLPVIDLDAEIARDAGAGIPEIFAAEGEAGFRRRELAALERIEVEETVLVDCGGGIVETAACVERLRASGVVLWLDAPWHLLWERLREGGGRRPLVGMLGREGLAALHGRRRPLYAAAADFRLRGDRLGLESLARQAMACSLFWSRNREAAS